MADRTGLCAGDEPFAIARAWLAEAEAREPNDASAMALATVDAGGLPNVRMVLRKVIVADAFVFYTNSESAKAGEIEGAGKAALVLHWKSLRRQIRARGTVVREEGPQADAFVFYTNYESVKATEIDASGRAALVMHWKSLRRQVRARGGAVVGGAAQPLRWRALIAARPGSG